MRFLQKISLCLLFFVSMTVQASAQFTDILHSNPYHTMLEQLEQEHIITGYDDQSFKPHATISRAHVAAIIHRAFSLQPVRPAVTFKDVPVTYPYHDDIQALYRAGVIDGNDGHFNPRAPLTRGQLAKILTNVFTLTQQTTTAFKDVALDHQYNSYIGALVSTKATTGYDDQSFRPNTYVTRQHFAVFFYRLKFNDTLPLSEVSTKKLEHYLNKTTKVQTNYGMFYASPSIDYAYVKSYATAFTNEEAVKLTSLLNIPLTKKPRFLVLDYPKDLAGYGGEIVDEPNILGWFNSLENVVVLTTNLQPRPLIEPDLALLNHEYFHWLLRNELQVHIQTLWVEEAMADNFGAIISEHQTSFVTTALFRESVKRIVEEGFANPTDPYSEESIVAIALLVDKYGIESLKQYLHLCTKMHDEDAFYKVYNMVYDDMFDLVKDYIADI